MVGGCRWTVLLKRVNGKYTQRVARLGNPGRLTSAKPAPRCEKNQVR
jgi:hypothetical protein